MSGLPDRNNTTGLRTPSRSKRLRYRVEHAVIRFMAWIVPKLPLGFVHGLANVFGTLGWLVDKRGRNNGMENLRAAFGAQYSPTQRRRLLRSSYRVFARTFFDLFWSPRLGKANWDRYFSLQCDTPAARAALDSNCCIFITAHCGGYEWLGIAKALHGQGSMTIAQDFKNPPLTAIFQKLRSAGGCQPVIPQEGALLRILRHIRKGGSAAALVDLTARPEEGATIIRTFGMLTSVSHFYCALAQRTGVPIVAAVADPVPGGRWVIHFLDAFTIGENDDPQEAAQRCWNIFEPIIRARPEYWMWMYKHWRYLPEDAAPGRYPEYARRHDAFDTLHRSMKAAAK